MLEFVRTARGVEPPELQVERVRAVGYQGLVWRAARGIGELKKHGNAAGAVDRIETDLRWAARIKAEMVRSVLPVLVRSLESAMGRPLEEVRAVDLVELMRESLTAAAGAVGSFHAEKGGRLAAPVGMAVTKVGAAWARARSRGGGDGLGGVERGKARAKLGPGVQVEDWTRRVSVWQVREGNLWLEPHASVRRGLGILDARTRRILELRFGWGGPARTLEEVAKEVGLLVVKVGAMERRAVTRAGKAGV